MSRIDRNRRIVLLAPLAAGVAWAAHAQGPGGVPMPGTDLNVRLADASATADAAPSTGAFDDALSHLRGALRQNNYTGDADVDFVRTMIPVQESLIEMARVARDYGDDPDVRRMAEQIIQERQTQLDFLKDWQKRHDTP